MRKKFLFLSGLSSMNSSSISTLAFEDNLTVILLIVSKLRAVKYAGKFNDIASNVIPLLGLDSLEVIADASESGGLSFMDVS